MRLVHRASVLNIVTLVAICPAAAEEKELPRQTLETMRRHVSSLQAVSRSAGGDTEKLKLVEAPVLRYSDPGGITTDGSIWLWEARGRPAAAAGIFFLTQEGREPKWSCELLSLADGGVEVRSQIGWTWSPASGGLHWRAIDEEPADSSRQRLRQMKQIAERYEVTAIEGTIRSQLRLMVQPLHRYADEQQGLLDGALFAFASGTNPEALLLLECRKMDDALPWQIAFARFGANAMEARQGEIRIWECPAIKRWNVLEPYFSRFGTVEQVFEPASEGAPKPAVD